MIRLLVFLVYLVSSAVSPDWSSIEFRNLSNTIFFYQDETLFPESRLFQSSLDELVKNESYYKEYLEHMPSDSFESVVLANISQTIPDWLSDYILKCKVVFIDGGFNSFIQDLWSSANVKTAVIKHLGLFHMGGDVETMRKDLAIGLNLTLKPLKLPKLDIIMDELDENTIKAIADSISRCNSLEEVSIAFNYGSYNAQSLAFEILRTASLKRFELIFDSLGKSRLSHYLKSNLEKSPVSHMRIISSGYILSEDELLELGPILSQSQLETLEFELYDICGISETVSNQKPKVIKDFANLAKESHLLNVTIRFAVEDGYSSDVIDESDSIVITEEEENELHGHESKHITADVEKVESDARDYKQPDRSQIYSPIDDDGFHESSHGNKSDLINVIASEYQQATNSVSYSIFTEVNRTESVKQASIYKELRDAYLQQNYEAVLKLAYHSDYSYREKRIVGWAADAVSDSKKQYALKALRNGNVDFSNIALKDDELGLILKAWEWETNVPSNVTLNLSGNSLTDKCIKSLIRAMKKFRILAIDLSNNQIDDDGLMQLSRKIPGSHLVNLDLSSNRIKDKGVCELAHNLAFGNRLRSLKLSRNTFGDDGIQCLGKSLEKSPLEELDLNGCIDISDVGLRAFIAKIPLSQLRSLHLEIWCFGEDTSDELVIASNNSQIYQLAFYSPGYHLSAIYDDFKQFGIDRNIQKYHEFEAIRKAFNERSYQEVVDLAATRTNARLVGWAREIVKVSRQYLKIEEVKEYRLKQLRNQPRKVNDEAVMENYTPIVEEIFIA